MQEYLNYNALTLFSIVLAIVFLIDIFGKKRSKFLYLLTAVFIGLVFLDAYNEYKTSKDNIKAFTTGISLICFSGGGQYSSPNKYKVSKEGGWVIDGGHFIKDGLMIRSNNCER